MRSRRLSRPYKAGWKTIIESDTFPKGLSEDVVRAISAKKREPEWMLEFRLKAYRKWLTMAEPEWSDNRRALLPCAVQLAGCKLVPVARCASALWFTALLRRYPRIDYQDVSYYSEPKEKEKKLR